jgi:hypothetical protein
MEGLTSPDVKIHKTHSVADLPNLGADEAEPDARSLAMDLLAMERG